MQTVTPSELIIIDASDNWADNKTVIRSDLDALLIPLKKSVSLQYHRAEVQSAAAQRNQGVRLASSDILFLIDDDTEMYVDCAERIMDVMGDDESSDVIGACASLSQVSPSVGSEFDNPRKGDESGEHFFKASAFRKIADWLRGRYLPEYSAIKADVQCPISLQEKYGCHLRHQVHGCRMIFRRRVFDEIQFEDALLKYSYLEDVDFGYRASKLGAILEVPSALVSHEESPKGRLSQYVTNSLAVSNAVFLTRKYSDSPWFGVIRVLLSATRRSALDFAKDTFSRDWKFTRFRGTLSGIRRALGVLSFDRASMDDQYKRAQEVFFASVS